MKKVLLSILTTLLIAGIIYYLTLPPINITSIYFWIFILLILTLYAFIYTVFSILINKNGHASLKIVKNIMYIVVAIVIILLLNTIIINPIFFSNSYSSLINIDEDNYSNIQNDYQNIILIDKQSAKKITTDILGDYPLLKSQFRISDDYTYINYNSKVYIVSALEYNSLFNYYINKDEGIVGYIMIDASTGHGSLVQLDKKMKYSPSSRGLYDLNRYLRLKYPSKVFGEKKFELDEEGNPYWIISTLKYNGISKIGDINGVIILNPVTGQSTFYDVNNIPSWVDNVYDEDLLMSQISDAGLYKNGFINSILGRKNGFKLNSTYSYLNINGNIYIYSGISSITSDNKNIGFIMSDLRTKDTKLYRISGISPKDATDKVKKEITKNKYKLSNPLLINIENRATYLIPLKDEFGLIKKLAFIDLKKDKNVIIFDNYEGIDKVISQYISITSDIIDEAFEKVITVSYISNAIIEGNTYYYLTDTDGQKYVSSISINDKKLPFIKVGDKLIVTYLEEKEIIELIKIN